MFGERYACSEQDLIDKLNKVPFPKSEAMMKGIAFENCLRKPGVYADGQFEFDPAVVDACYKHTEGGIWQTWVDLQIFTYDYEFTIGGYTDVIRRNVLKDVKTTKQYSFPAFDESYQHKVYLLGAEQTGAQIDQFDYVVCDFKEVYVETYFFDSNAYKASVLAIMRDVAEFIRLRRHLITNPKLFT